MGGDWLGFHQPGAEFCLAAGAVEMRETREHFFRPLICGSDALRDPPVIACAPLERSNKSFDCIQRWQVKHQCYLPC